MTAAVFVFVLGVAAITFFAGLAFAVDALRQRFGINPAAVSAKIRNALAGAQPDKWNAWRFPTPHERTRGADEWDLVFVGSADFPEDAREMLPRQGGQVQEGLTGAVTTYVDASHELAEQERRRFRERAARKGGDAA